MLGTVDPQLTLLDTASWYGHLVDEDSFYAKLARHGEQIVTDADFEGCYAEGRGRPSIPPSILMRACLLALHDDCSDRETARRCRADLDWKYALGLPIDHPGFHPTTFSVFRSRILINQADEALFRKVVARAVEAGVLPRRALQVIDSSAILGAGAVKDTYDLLRSGIRRLYRAAGEHTLPRRLRRKVRRYLGEGKPRIDWQDPAARRGELRRMVEAADLLLRATADRPELGEDASLLRQLIDQDVDREPPDGGGPAIRRGTAPDRVVSTTDPEMRHGRKSKSRRFDGYKVHLTAEPTSELITAVEVTPANVFDGEVAADLVRQARANGAAPTQLVGDMAYGGGDVRAAVAEAGAEVVAKVPPTAPTGRFTKDAFTIDPGVPSATCPQGVVTTELRRAGRDRRGRPVTMLVFPDRACSSCPLRARCVGGTGPRTVRLHPHEALLIRARRDQAKPSIRRKLRDRVVIERKIDHLKDRGLRKARYRGRRMVLLQARWCAALANIKRLFTLDAFRAPPEGRVCVA
jgi:transposase